MTKSKLSALLEKFLSDAKNLRQNRPVVFNSILAGIVLLIIGCMALMFMSFASGLSKVSPQNAVAMPTMFATTTMDPLRQAASATPTYIPTITSTPIPSNLWVVSQLLGKQNVNGYTALVVEFKNLSTSEIKKGQCQSPHDPAPVVGDVFVAEVKGDYILLSPTIGGTSQIDLSSKVQRFIFIP